MPAIARHSESMVGADIEALALYDAGRKIRSQEYIGHDQLGWHREHQSPSESHRTDEVP